MTLEIYVDIALAVLLVATVFYAARLNKRLGMLRRDRGELAALVAQFNAATAAAEAAMEGLRASAENSGRALQGAVDKARGTTTDLNFLVERGEQAADRLDTAIRRGRGLEHPAPEPAAASSPTRAAATSRTGAMPRPGATARAEAAPDRAAMLKAIERLE